MALFGSVLRDDFRPESDVDVLVEFEPGHVPGLAFFDMQEELSTIFGRKVDLNTPGFLSHYFRSQVLKEAEVQYDAADLSFENEQNVDGDGISNRGCTSRAYLGSRLV